MKKSTIIAEFDSTIQQSVLNAYPSIFTKDDVIALLRDLQNSLLTGVEAINDAGDTAGNSSTLSDEQVKALTLCITDAICSHSDTQSLINDYDLSMSYREVEIDSITFDDGNIEDAVKEGINEWINNNTNN